MSNEIEAPAVDLRAAKELLERPFTAAAVEFVVVSIPKEGTKAAIATYLSRTSVEDRLDFAVGPERWEVENVPHAECVDCHLSLFGTTRSSLGQGSDRRAQEANALKRAAKSFGVGRYLYKRPLIHRGVGNGEQQVHRRGRSAWIPPRLEAELRGDYERYLAEAVVPLYGEPIDHGDRAAVATASRSGDGASTSAGNGAAQPAGAGNGGGRPRALPPRGDGSGPAHPSVRGELKAQILAGGFSGETVADLAELLYGERVSDRLGDGRLRDLTQALETAVAGAVAEATLGGLAARGLRQPDRDEARKALLAFLLGRAQRREEEL